MKMRWLVAPLAGIVFSGAAGADGLWDKKRAGEPELLPAESAFQLVSAERTGDAVQLEWVIAPGYYLYRKRLAFESVAPAGTKLGEAKLPQGANLHDEHFGNVEVYRETLRATLPLIHGKAAPQQLRVRYQGCADAGVCYPPVTRVVDVVVAAPAVKP